MRFACMAVALGLALGAGCSGSSASPEHRTDSARGVCTVAEDQIHTQAPPGCGFARDVRECNACCEGQGHQAGCLVGHTCQCRSFPGARLDAGAARMDATMGAPSTDAGAADAGPTDASPPCDPDLDKQACQACCEALPRYNGHVFAFIEDCFCTHTTVCADASIVECDMCCELEGYPGGGRSPDGNCRCESIPERGPR
jgi:hypothetical protein